MNRFFTLVLILSLLLCAVGCKSVDDTAEYVDPDLHLADDALRDTVLYYRTDSGYIIPVMKQIPYEEGIGKAVLSYLVASEDNVAESRICGLEPMIPDGTELSLSIDENGNAVLDVRNMPDLASEDDEKAFLQTVTNTLLEFDSIQTVSFRFDGKKLDKLTHGTHVNDNLTGFALNPISTEAFTSTNGEPVTVFVPDGTYKYNIPMTGYVTDKSSFESIMNLFCECCAMQDSSMADCKVISATISDSIAAVNFSEELAQLAVVSDGVVEAIARAALLTAMQMRDVDEIRIFADSEKLMETTATNPMYVNEWR